MKTLVCIEPGNLVYADATTPHLQPDHAIINIKRVGICGTDLHAFEGTQPFFSYPRILGHELSGELVDFNNAPGFYKGEAVTFLPYFNCGNCIACRTDKTNCCTHLKVCGVHVDGGFVEYLSVPSKFLVHGENLSLDELALTEPLAIGAHGVKRAAIDKNEFVLVMGAGPIGLSAILFLQRITEKIIVLDVNDHRLNHCKIFYGLAISSTRLHQILMNSYWK